MRIYKAFKAKEEGDKKYYEQVKELKQNMDTMSTRSQMKVDDM